MSPLTPPPAHAAPFAALEHLAQRLLRYRRRSGIRLLRSPRHSGGERLGLPDLRGFSPHRRVVHLYRDHSRSATCRRLAGPVRRWRRADCFVLHDLLHIVFWDAAARWLGGRAFDDPARFQEIHLASEAFAVLALDYHGLIHVPGGGLAASVDPHRYARFAATRGLPALTSRAFCRELLRLYFAGESRLFRRLRRARQPWLARWLGHERRYSTKQRLYVAAWLADLRQDPGMPRPVRISSSAVLEPLWTLVQLFCHAPPEHFERHLAEVVQRIDGGTTYLGRYRKIRRLPRQPDFRYTDLRAVPRARLVSMLSQDLPPSGSSLFLLWQILALTGPHLLSAPEQAAVRRLAHAAEGVRVSRAVWRPVLEICRRRARKLRFRAHASHRACFFLP